MPAGEIFDGLHKVEIETLAEIWRNGAGRAVLSTKIGKLTDQLDDSERIVARQDSERSLARRARAEAP